MTESLCTRCAFKHLCPSGIEKQSKDIRVTGCSCYKRQTNTNADRIRAKSDEELAKWIADIYPDCPPGYNCDSSRVTDCCDCWLDWLKQEADE